MINHFGINIQEKPSNHINKELYLSAKPEGMSGWTESSYVSQRIKADINYDSNMRYFDSLNYEKFNAHLGKLIKKFKLKECMDLKKLEGKQGLYVIVLDKYKQIYIGKSDDIKKRVHQGHWNKSKSLERLIFGDMFTSKISIDSFVALDTTRVYYYLTYDCNKLEEKMVEYVDQNYLLNRTAGGIGSFETYTDDAASALLAVAANRKKRNLLQFTDLNRMKELPKGTLEFYLRRYPELTTLMKRVCVEQQSVK